MPAARLSFTASSSKAVYGMQANVAKFALQAPDLVVGLWACCIFFKTK
jgi:hypothetical protein